MKIRYIENKNEIIIVRVYGDTPVITVPESIDGKPVIGLYKYCFSEKSVDVEDTEMFSSEDTKDSVMFGEDIEDDIPVETIDAYTDIAGDFLEEIYLPDTLASIGDYCFYKCRNLKSISLGDKRVELGSDVFMNCSALRTIYIRGKSKSRTSLRQILLHRTAETDVFFDDAAILFPEVHESYELIGPAHIFELNVEGQGIRARQCFEDDVFSFEMYDRIFEQAVGSEDEKMLCRMAAYRLKYPSSIQKEHKKIYEAYLIEHTDVFCDDMISRKELDLLEDLGRQGLVSKEFIDMGAGDEVVVR